MAIFLCLLVLLAITEGEEIRTVDSMLTIEDGVLKSVTQLLQNIEDLDLSNRGIKEIEDGVFTNVSMRILNLESNEISSLQPDTFAGLRMALEEINVGSNRIDVLDFPFLGMMRLKLLNISNNPIDFIAAGELAGVPYTADVLVRGNKIHTLSTNAFEQADLEPSTEASIHNVERVERDEPNQFTDSLVSLAEEAQIFLIADKFIDDEYDPSPSEDRRIKVCVEDSILKQIAILAEGETLPKNCMDDVIDGGSRYLDIQNRGLRGIDKGWYQLEQIPISVISFSRNNLTDFLPELLNDLPESVKIVDLSHNFIRRIEKDAFSNVHLKAISFKGNLIGNVEDGSFESSNLWGLYFTENKISDISMCASLPVSLNQLYLSRNNISHIPSGIFSGLEKLVQLDLDRNAITKIQQHAFKGLKSLDSINLVRNQISMIEAGAFIGLEKLDRILLNGNSISSCGNGVFEGLDNLKSIFLASNKFENITKSNFDGLPATLMFLDLQENEITHIENGVFESLPKNTLKLNGNKLSKILPGQFKINKLEELHLEDNLINEISQDSFQGLSALKYLFLAENQISEIPRYTVKNLNSLTILDISKNPMTKLENGAFYGTTKTLDGEILIRDNKLEVIQGGIFEDV